MKKDYIEKIEWAISFSQKDLKGLREGDWLNLKDELYEFLHGLDPWHHIGRKWDHAIVLKHIPKPQFIKNTTIADVEEIKKVLSIIFKLILHVTGAVSPIYTKKAHIFLVSMSPTSPFTWRTYVDNDLLAAKMNLGDYLDGSEITQEQIRICPECDRYFLLKRKPRKDKTFYCSVRCANNASTRAHRERQAKRSKMKVTHLPGATGGRSGDTERWKAKQG